MGRMSRTRRKPYRLVAVFALTVLVPAVVLAVLAWRGVEKERRALVAEREGGIRRAGILIRKDLSRTIESLKVATPIDPT